MRKVHSAGVLIFRRQPKFQLLVLIRGQRFDFPKGHLESGESPLDCALRELAEETALQSHDICLVPNFEESIQYVTRYRRFNNKRVTKTVTCFAAELEPELSDKIRLSEHQKYEWRDLTQDLSQIAPSLDKFRSALLSTLADR